MGETKSNKKNNHHGELFLHLPDRENWRQWLQEYHEQMNVVWLVFLKKHTGKTNMTYKEALDEALCFGWIDSIIKKLDQERYARKFTPRTNRAKWSAVNRRRARELYLEGKMTPAGLAVTEDWIRQQDAGIAELPPPATGEISPDLIERLQANPKAWSFFQSLPPGHRRLYGRWIMEAKREETRRRRMEEAIVKLSREEPLGMK